MRRHQILAHARQIVEPLAAHQIVEGEHAVFQFGDVADIGGMQPGPRGGGAGALDGLAAQTSECLFLIVQQFAQTASHAGERANQDLVRSARAALSFDQTAELHQVGLLSFVHVVQPSKKILRLGCLARRFDLDAIRERGDEFLENFALANEVLLKILARVLNDEVKRARDADLAARDIVAILGLDAIRHTRARREHGRGRLEGRGGAHLARALRIFEQVSLLGSVVHAVDNRDLRQSVIVVGVVGDFHRSWCRQLQMIGGTDDVDLGRPVGLDHDLVGVFFAYRPAKKRQKPHSVRSIFRQRKCRPELAVIEIGHQRAVLSGVAQKQSRLAGRSQWPHL